jgi:molybdopterin-guanine dinucleotide biosynthesis protein
MQVLLELDDDQIESVLVEGLKRNYEVHLQMHEDNEHHIHEAFHIMMAYFMSEKDYAKYMHGLAKVHKKYNAKRLAEANNGL